MDDKRKLEIEQPITNKKQKTKNAAIKKSDITLEQKDETPVTVETENKAVPEETNTVQAVKEDVTVNIINDVKNADDTILKNSHTTHLLSPPRQDRFEESYNETSLRNQRHIEPVTPPGNQHCNLSLFDAPLKTYVSAADKLRMEDERNTLEKLQKVLDIVLTDRASRNVPSLYSQIESPLRNSTRRGITISHVLKVMYIAPKLYSMQAKEIRRFGNKVVEDYLIEFEKEWPLPLSPKDYASRKEMIHDGLKAYFEAHQHEPNATVPEAALPKLATVVDTKEWIKEAKLPPGVKSLLEAHSKVKEEKIESQTPKPTPKGSVKDRMAALRARLANKK
ncbi:unnamed protein product [Rhizopus stolonifer]